MNERIEWLRQQSFAAVPAVSAERALLVTRTYRDHHGKHSVPVLRARVDRESCEHQAIYLGAEELVVGKRGPAPASRSTYPAAAGSRATSPGAATGSS